MYLAKAHDKAQVTTIEGSHETALIAKQLFDDNGIKNIQVIQGNIDQELPRFLDSIEKIDFAFIDANHRFEPQCVMLS
jgi:predicted O-methyltransferase YrrM